MVQKELRQYEASQLTLTLGTGLTPPIIRGASMPSGAGLGAASALVVKAAATASRERNCIFGGVCIGN